MSAPKIGGGKLSITGSEQPKDMVSGSASTGHIVVALDSSRNSIAALRAAVELASMLGVELEGLFIEDVNLTQLCRFPFQREVGSYTGAVRRLDDSTLRRQLRAMADSIRQSVEEEAGQRTVRWTFNVRQGAVVDELLTASKAASIMTIGKASRRQHRLGSTARSVIDQALRPILILGEKGEMRTPLTVIYTGSESSQRALQFARNLVRNDKTNLLVLLWVDRANVKREALLQQVESYAASLEDELLVKIADGNAIRSAVASEAGTLVIPREYADLLSEREGATILIP